MRGGLNPNAYSFVPSWGPPQNVSRQRNGQPQQHPHYQQHRYPVNKHNEQKFSPGMFQDAGGGYRQQAAYGQRAGYGFGIQQPQQPRAFNRTRDVRKPRGFANGVPNPSAFTGGVPEPSAFTGGVPDPSAFTGGVPNPSAFTHDNSVPPPNAFTHEKIPHHNAFNQRKQEPESSASVQSISEEEGAEFMSDRSEKSPPPIVKPPQAEKKPAPLVKQARSSPPVKSKGEKQRSMPTQETSVKKKKASKKLIDFKPFDSREHLNIVFMGHVDAGKSTMSGQILLQMGKIDERTIEKYEREAKEKNRESWWIAYIMDENEEERAKGKTVELGRAHFETANKRYTILDAPGHKLYVPNMISGAQQADVGVLIISARKGEFEAGFARQGQTREHSILAHTLGITRVVVVVNKMDDHTVKWDKERFDDIKNRIQDFLTHKVGFKDKYVKFLPVSAQTGDNILKKVSPELCPWYKGESFIGTLDELKKIKRCSDEGLRIPVDIFDVSGKKTAVGKVESGKVYIGQKLVLMPEMIKTEVLSITIDEKEAEIADTGEQVTVLIKQPANDSIVNGAYVICDEENPCPRVREFECLLEIKELMAHKPLMSAGYQAVIHVHNAAKPCEVVAIDNLADMKTGRFSKKPPPFLKEGQAAVMRLRVPTLIPLESSVPLGRFTLRDEGKTIAIGKVTSTDEKTFGHWVQKEAAKGKEKIKEKKAGKKSKKDKKHDKKGRKK